MSNVTSCTASDELTKSRLRSCSKVQRTFEVLHEHLHFTDVVERLGVGHEAEDRGTHRHGVECCLRVHGIGVLADDVGCGSLGEPVDEDHIGAREFLRAGDVADNVLAVVDEEFEVETRDTNACIAWAGCCVDDVPKPFLKGEVRRFDRVHQHRWIHCLRVDIGEGRITFELGELEDRLDRADDRFEQISDDILGVHQLGAAHVFGVAADIGEQQTSVFRGS